MALRLRKSSERIFDLTPMIDCVFQLLIFFLVVARFAEEERQMDVMLPEASEAKPIAARVESLYINIDAEGKYHLGGRAVALESLRKSLQAAATNNPGRQSVVLRADRRCPWEFVLGAINACQEARIHDYRVTAREG